MLYVAYPYSVLCSLAFGVGLRRLSSVLAATALLAGGHLYGGYLHAGPSMRPGTDLLGQLSELAARAPRDGLHVEFNHATLRWPAALSSLGSRQRAALTGAISEALTNVVKHAATATAVLRLTATPAALVVTLVDQSRGFDPAAQPEGMGLRQSIRGRITGSGGTVRIETALRAGTYLEITMPLASSPARCPNGGASPLGRRRAAPTLGSHPVQGVPVTPGRASWLGSSLSDHFGRLPARSLPAGLPGRAISWPARRRHPDRTAPSPSSHLLKPVPDRLNRSTSPDSGFAGSRSPAGSPTSTASPPNLTARSNPGSYFRTHRLESGDLAGQRRDGAVVHGLLEVAPGCRVEGPEVAAV